MIEFVKYFAKRRAALTAVFLLHIFTFIPASILLWLESNGNNFYYVFAGGIAIITGWIVLEAGIDLIKAIPNFRKGFLFPVNILFFLLYFVFGYSVPEFYYRVAAFLAPVELNYAGPNRILVFFIVMVGYNLFFIPKILKRK
jgi:hypothetical protein